MQFPEKIFSLKTENEHKILTILGIKIRFIYNNTLGIKNDTSEIKNILCSIQSDITALQSDSTKIKNDISKINTLNNTGWLGLTEKAIAEYILNSPTYGSDLQNLLECFDSDDKTKIISDLNNIYVRYKSNGKITFHDLSCFRCLISAFLMFLRSWVICSSSDSICCSLLRISFFNAFLSLVLAVA